MSHPTSTPEDDAPTATQTYLVGDIGGTNCRLALATAERGGVRIEFARRYRCADFSTAAEAIDNYLDALGRKISLSATVIAVAGPVSGGLVQSTNMPWRLCEADLRGYGAGGAKLINDYTALGLALDHLSEQDTIRIGPDVPGDKAETVAVIGAGTGFGVGALTRGVGGQAVIATEGGHVSFAPVDEVELEILRVLRSRFGRVSVERLLSGPGLTNIHAALAEIDGVACIEILPEEIFRQAESGDALSRRALERFCCIYGSVAGDMALVYGARGGVFLGGGIAPALATYLQAGEFRRRFEDKGRFRDYLASVPTRIISNTNAALLGAGALAAGFFPGGPRTIVNSWTKA
jgi:glucokinase